MSATVLDIKPNRSLLNPNFGGYKLSLNPISTFQKEFTTEIDKVSLGTDAFGILHFELFGQYNHLVGENIDNKEFVYFVDKDWNLCKTHVEAFRLVLVDPLIVWSIPKRRDRIYGDYNISFKFVNNSMCVLSDGMGTLHILNTGSRQNNDLFNAVYSDKVTESDDRGFLIEDAVLISKESSEELHVAIKYLKPKQNSERLLTVINWITFKKIDDKWGQTAFRELQSEEVRYVHFDKKCEHILIISDNGTEFTLNSEKPIEKKYKHTWDQTLESITIKIDLPNNFQQNKLQINTNNTNISVNYEDKSILQGLLGKEIDSSSVDWKIEDKVLTIVLKKAEVGTNWDTLITENLTEDELTTETKKDLIENTNEEEADQNPGLLFNSQQIEECDLEHEKNVYFERICGTTNEIVNKANFGSNPVVLTVNNADTEPPAFGIRHDVDVLMWQPKDSETGFSLTHEGTLHAFGYIQASKKQRKFTVCSPDLNTIAICQYTRYLFLYKQKIMVTSGELRNRNSGRHIQSVANQYVLNIPNEDVMGIYISNKLLFILGAKFITVYNINIE